MAVRSVKEMTDLMKEYTKDKTDDNTISFVEDFTDTINSLDKLSGSAQELQNKYDKDMADMETKLKEQDNKWREKYIDRFYSGDKPDDDFGDKPPKKKFKNFEDLFKYE